MRGGLRVITRENMRKVRDLVRDHRLRQIVNTLRFGLHALRGFPSVVLPYEPLWLVLLISGRCNLRCRQCPIHCPESAAGRGRDMSMDLFVSLLDRFKGAIALSLSGGEPMLHPNLFEMIDVAAARRLKVHIPTNGTALPGLVDRLLETPIEMLNVSLYGIDREGFASHTGARPELFDATVEAIAELARKRRSRGYPRLLRLSFIGTADTIHQVRPFVQLAERLGVDQVKIKNIAPFRVTAFARGQCLFTDVPEVRHVITGLRDSRPSIPVFLPRLYRRDGTAHDCTMPFRLLTIDGSGAVAPCCVRGVDRRWGLITDRPDPWNGRILQAARRRALDLERPMPFLCRHCEENIDDRRYVGG